MKELFQTGFFLDYFIQQPRYFLQRIKRYNLARFIGKVQRKILENPILIDIQKSRRL